MGGSRIFTGGGGGARKNYVRAHTSRAQNLNIWKCMFFLVLMSYEEYFVNFLENIIWNEDKL